MVDGQVQDHGDLGEAVVVVQAQDPEGMTQLQKERMNDCNSKARLHLLLLYVRKELRIY